MLEYFIRCLNLRMLYQLAYFTVVHVIIKILLKKSLHMPRQDFCLGTYFRCL